MKPKTPYLISNFGWRNAFYLLVVLHLAVPLVPAQAIGPSNQQPVYVGPIPNESFKSGRVMARSIVLDDDGNPILVEYDTGGVEGKVIDIGNLSVADIDIIPAADYLYFKNQYDDFNERYMDSLAKDAELLTRREYQQSSFVAADGETIIEQPSIKDGVNSVLVRGQSNRLIDDPEQLILLKFSVDLTQNNSHITDKSQTLVVNKEGQVIAQSEINIGYRTGYFGDPNEAQNDRGSVVNEEDQVFGKLKNVKSYLDENVYPTGVDTTDEDGKYSFKFYMSPCPIGGFTYLTDVSTKLNYRNFLPSGASSRHYYLRTPGYTHCSADLVPSNQAVSVKANFLSYATPFTQTNLFVDVMFVGGHVSLENVIGEKVEVADTTSYTYFEEDAKKITQSNYDFNGDGEPDFVSQGSVFECTNDDGDEIDVFRPDETTNNELTENPDGYICVEADSNQGDDESLQAIFFDGSQKDAFDYPDLVRLIDQEFRGEPIGVLKNISVDDLRNTDLLFFRESTGQLIMERRGLKEAEAKESDPSDTAEVEYDDEKIQIAYRVMLRGRDDLLINQGGDVGNRTVGYEAWATEYQLTEAFQKRESDHPRPGEFIKIVAINRATGYLGTARVQLKSAGDTETNSLDVAAPHITMLPPNLKIWAERDYTVKQGYTAGDERNYTIGNEGAALTSDTIIRIFTEWTDENGRPLPEDLGSADGIDYGYTARFAKIAGNNILQKVAAGNDLSEFPVKPGRQTQTIQVNDNLTTAEHYYIHVIGKPKGQKCVVGSSCPSFDSTGAGIYSSRPKLLVPFLTPIPNEDKNWLSYNEYRKLKREYETAENNAGIIEPTKPIPAYSWQYRPEYQISQYEFNVDRINRTYVNEEGEGESENILDDEVPSVYSADALILVFYSLASAEFSRLSPIDGSQDLVFAVGEEEVSLSVEGSSLVVFNNLESLAQLDPEDYLTMRLYTNQDSANVLWEWAFYLDLEFIDLFSEPIRERTIASNPRPVIHLGIGNDLDPVTAGDISFDSESRIATVSLSGKVYCDIADLSEGGLANISSIEIHVTNPNEEDGRRIYTVALQDISDIEVNELQPYPDFGLHTFELRNIKIEDEKHPFIGYFQTQIEFEVGSGTQIIQAVVKNAIGNEGYSSVGVEFSANADNYQIERVENYERDLSDRGIYSPFWVRVSDNELTPENIEDKVVNFMDEDHSIVLHSDGYYYADKPFLLVTTPTTGEDIGNIKNVVAEPSALRSWYDNEQGGPPLKVQLNSTYTAAQSITDDEEWLANTFTYATGSTVGIFWAADDFEDDWEVSFEESEVYEQINDGIVALKDHQPDNDIKIKAINKIEGLVNGKQLYQFVLDIKQSAKNFPLKHIHIVLTKEVDGETKYDYARADFKTSPLKTVILAVDGLGFKSFNDLLSGPDAENFKKLFGGGKTLGNDKAALSALPTITWANWPGVFSGGSPSEHGWTGNSFVPRDMTNNTTNPNLHLPLYSDEAELCGTKLGVALNPLCTSARQLAGVASGGNPLPSAYNMDTRSPSTAGSLYDIIADELQATADKPLKAESIRNFYERAQNKNVKMNSKHFVLGDPTDHSGLTAAKLDSISIMDAITVWRNEIIITGDGGEEYDFSHPGNFDIMSIYLPGTDNAGHTFGNAHHQPGDRTFGQPIEGDEYIDVVNPPDILREHASRFTDLNLGQLLEEIQKHGHQNSVLFALTADHGQHTFRNTDGELEQEQEQEREREREPDFVLYNRDIARLFKADKINGGMGIPHWGGGTSQLRTEDPRGDYYVNEPYTFEESRAVYSANGAFSQFYLRDENGTWQDPPNREDVVRLSALLYRESLGLSPIAVVCEMQPRNTSNSDSTCVQIFCEANLPGTRLHERCQQNTDPTDPLIETVDMGNVTSDGVYGKVPAIFVRISDHSSSNHFLSNYRWLKGVTQITDEDVLPVEYSIELDSIDNFISASGKGPDQWPALKERIEEFNHQYSLGSRSGDIITILNGEQGHLSVPNSVERYPGWHGGPTRSESEVPLVFAMMGNAFTDSDGAPTPLPEALVTGYNEGKAASNIKADGHLRNWHLTHVLKKILKEFRGPQ